MSEQQDFSWLKIAAAVIIAGGTVVAGVIQGRSALEAARIQASAGGAVPQESTPPAEASNPIGTGTDSTQPQPNPDPPDHVPPGKAPEQEARSQAAPDTMSVRADVPPEDDRSAQEPARCAPTTIEIWPGAPRSVCNDSVAVDVEFGQERGVEFATTTAVDALGQAHSMPVMGNRGSLRVESASGTVVLSVLSVDWEAQHLKLRVTPVGDR